MRRLAMGSLWIGLMLTVATAACSGASSNEISLENLPQTDGIRHTISQSRASVLIPKGWRIAAPTSWLRQVAPELAILLHIERLPEPEGGAQTYVDRMIADTTSAGEADIESDRRVRLGDLDARLVQTVELRGAAPKALWSLVVSAEDGMWLASVLGPVSDLRAKRSEVMAALLSLRIDAPPGAPRQDGRPLPPELELELPEAVTPSESSAPPRK